MTLEEWLALAETPQGIAEYLHGTVPFNAPAERRKQAALDLARARELWATGGTALVMLSADDLIRYKRVLDEWERWKWEYMAVTPPADIGDWHKYPYLVPDHICPKCGADMVRVPVRLGPHPRGYVGADVRRHAVFRCSGCGFRYHYRAGR